MKKNVILISLDTFRADVAYSGRLPVFSALRKRGISFQNAIASAPITPVSHASVFTGLQPDEHGLRHLFKEKLDINKATLAQLFRMEGYNTGAIVSCPGLNKWYGFDKGFSHYDDDIPLLADGTDPLQTIDVKLRGTALKRAPEVVKKSIEWLEKNKKSPFFMFIHFFDTHWPYQPPELFGDVPANDYEGEALYMDYYLGRFIEQLEDWHLIDSTLIVLFGDHGEDLGGWYENDHAGVRLGHPEEEGHGCLLFDATQRVPLVIIDPNADLENKNVESQVRLIDILPTIVDLVGLDDPYERPGESLKAAANEELLSEPRVAYSETYYREEQSNSGKGIPDLGPLKSFRVDNKLKIIFDVKSGKAEFYDLIKDPNEKHPESFE